MGDICLSRSGIFDSVEEGIARHWQAVGFFMRQAMKEADDKIRKNAS